MLLVPQPALASHTWEGSLTRHTLPPGPTWPSRDYLVYLPAPAPDGADGSGPPLVVYLHGCTQPAEEAALGTGWNDLADEHGAVVVYPEQRVPTEPGDTDGSGARCWNAGQAGVQSRDHGEIASVARITAAVADEHGVDEDRIYVAGISGGALMATTMAASYPDLYAALASVAGCPYMCADLTGDLAYRRMGPHARVMPTIVFQGTADYVVNPVLGEAAVNQWVGTNDLADNGAPDGSVSRIPTSVEHHGFEDLQPAPGSGDPCLRSGRNPCPAGILGIDSYPYTIREYTDGSGSTVVESWLIHGLAHNYPGGSTEGSFTDPHGPDITAASWEFFERATSD